MNFSLNLYVLILINLTTAINTCEGFRNFKLSDGSAYMARATAQRSSDTKSTKRIALSGCLDGGSFANITTTGAAVVAHVYATTMTVKNNEEELILFNTFVQNMMVHNASKIRLINSNVQAIICDQPTKVIIDHLSQISYLVNVDFSTEDQE